MPHWKCLSGIPVDSLTVFIALEGLSEHGGGELQTNGVSDELQGVRSQRMHEIYEPNEEHEDVYSQKSCKDQLMEVVPFVSSAHGLVPWFVAAGPRTCRGTLNSKHETYESVGALNVLVSLRLGLIIRASLPLKRL